MNLPQRKPEVQESTTSSATEKPAIVIRPATASDVPELYMMLAQVQDECYPIKERNRTKAYTTVQGIVDNHFCLIALCDDKIVGSLALLGTGVVVLR